MFEEIFARRELVPVKLAKYGFSADGDRQFYRTEIADGEFLLEVSFTEKGRVETVVTEKDTDEEYTLYKTAAQGSFVGEIRAEIETVLRDIAERCFKFNFFKQAQTLRIVDHVSEVYGDELEFLWQKTSDNGIWRRKDSQKWYGVILFLSRRKLGLDSDEIVEILNLHTSPENLESLLSQGGFYPGWHMNKKHWVTVILDDSVSDWQLHELIAESYRLGKK